MIIAVTGHRPDKLGGYGLNPKILLTKFAIKVLEDIKPQMVITGMALGWDTAIAVAAHMSKIPFIAAIPCRNQECRWRNPDKDIYYCLLDNAHKIIMVSEEDYIPGCMELRNEWMVDNSESVLAIYNGTSGGTANCVKYAISIKKPLINCWNDWIKFNESKN